MSKDDLKGLRKFWTVMYWLSIGLGVLHGAIILAVGTTKMLAFAVACDVFNLLASNWWITFIDKELEKFDE